MCVHDSVAEYVGNMVLEYERVKLGRGGTKEVCTRACYYILHNYQLKGSCKCLSSKNLRRRDGTEEVPSRDV